MARLSTCPFPNKIRQVLDGSSSHQPLVFGADELVALASGFLEPFAVEDADSSAAVVDDLAALQHAGRSRDAGAADAKHLRQKLLRQDDLVAGDPVVRHEQPSCAPLLDRMDAVAGGGLPDLGQEGLRVAVDDVAQRSA